MHARTYCRTGQNNSRRNNVYFSRTEPRKATFLARNDVLQQDETETMIPKDQPQFGRTVPLLVMQPNLLLLALQCMQQQWLATHGAPTVPWPATTKERGQTAAVPETCNRGAGCAQCSPTFLQDVGATHPSRHLFPSFFRQQWRTRWNCHPKKS